jgi:hypothetical protein
MDPENRIMMRLARLSYSFRSVCATPNSAISPFAELLGDFAAHLVTATEADPARMAELNHKNAGKGSRRSL